MKNAPFLAATPIGEFSPPEQQGHQLDPRPELITTLAGRVVKLPPSLITMFATRAGSKSSSGQGFNIIRNEM